MRYCSVCKIHKEVTKFNKNKAKRDGIGTICRECSHERFKAYYERNKIKQKAIVTERKKKVVAQNRLLLLNYLQSHPCVDCGETDPVVLEFDHIADKEGSVPRMATLGLSWKTVQKEIDKCEVRCANCHRRITAKRAGNWYKSMNL